MMFQRGFRLGAREIAEEFAKTNFQYTPTGIGNLREIDILSGGILARLAEDQTITGNWTFQGQTTFSTNPISDVGPPVVGSDAANKTYVDGLVAEASWLGWAGL